MADHRREGAAESGEIEGAVLGYLRDHPQAADTLDGIVNWWLPLQRYETARSRIERALGRLVAGGQLRRDRLPDGAVLYALNEKARPPRAH
ncbi:MAG TPA: hypothetical protein VF216_04790 [Mizugakiibacter sp.]